MNKDWIYDHLRPFLTRMPRQAAYDALAEMVDRGHLTLDQIQSIVDAWAADEVTKEKPDG